MKMRIIGAILILAIGIPILWIGGNTFVIACGILGILALKELLDLKEHHKKIPKEIYGLSIILLLLLLTSGIRNQFNVLEMDYSLIALAFLSLFLPSIFYKEKEYGTHEAIYLFGSILFLTLFWNALIFIRLQNIWLLVYLIFIAIFTDTFAFLIGKLIGSHKCSPTISPNKTWEGSIGGTLMGVFISSVFYFFVIKDLYLLKIVLLSLVLSIIGQLGDLVFSKMKRENNIKDFSNTIPGHGGILDRFDSLIFIVLGYLVFMRIF